MLFKNVILFSHRAGQKRLGVDKTPYFLNNLIHPDIKKTDVHCHNMMRFTLRHSVYQIDGMKFPDFSPSFPCYIFSS